MANNAPPGRTNSVAALANARQTIDLLRSQLRAGMVEKDYWLARLDNLTESLDIFASDRAADGQGRLGVLYEVSKLIGSSLDLQEVLSQAMDAIIQLTGAERGFLMLLDETGELEVKAARNVAKETLDGEGFAVSRSVIRAVAESGNPVVTTNATEDPRFASQASVMMHSLRSIQCVPLRARGQVIGVVYVDNRIHTGVFEESDLEMLNAFATQAAVAIENARLFTLTDEALAARVSELSLMQSIDRQLNETLDFSKVMALTLDWSIKITHATNGVIGLIDLENGTTQIVAQQGKELKDVMAVLEGAPAPAGHNLLAVPIQREGRVIGIIAIDRDDERPFDDEARDFVARLADHAAISIENTQLYQAVQRANQAKTEFVSVVTHELRVPMTSIKGYAEMMSMSGNISEQQTRFLDIIMTNVERMNVLVSDLSDVARIESGRLKLEIDESINLKEVVEKVVPSMQNEIERREHKVKIDMPEKLPSVKADPQRLAQILTNLVSNAYKYTPNGGTITIKAKKQQDMVRCEVTDSGVGMTQEELARLFTKFWRADNAHVREQPGTGLGLTITKNLVELQGGELDVHSEKGSGTTFGFTLPASK